METKLKTWPVHGKEKEKGKEKVKERAEVKEKAKAEEKGKVKDKDNPSSENVLETEKAQKDHNPGPVVMPTMPKARSFFTRTFPI